MKDYMRGFAPYGLAAFLVGAVGGFSAVLGPSFVNDIGIAYNNTTWTALAQAASSAAFAPVLGRLGDAVGRRRGLLFGLGFFTLGNLLSALASSLFAMLVARFIVGMGMAAIAPAVIGYIVTEFPQEKTGKGFALYMLISSISVVFGPVLGQLIVASSGWRSMMWLCTGLCIAVLLLCLLFKERVIVRKDVLKGFDKAGALWVFLFFTLLLCIPSFGQNFGWISMQFIAVAIGAALCFAALILTERKAENPILPGDFIRRKSFILAVVILFLTQGLMQANMTNTIVFMSYINPDESLVSGIAISVMYIGMSIGSVLSGALTDRYEPKAVLTFSLVLTALSCLLNSTFTASSSALQIVISLGLLGIGLGGNATGLMKVALSDLPPASAGAATGTYGLFRDLSAPFGVAVFVPLFTNAVANGISLGIDGKLAATDAMEILSYTELVCVVCGIIAVMFLPRIHNRKDDKNEG